MRQSSRRQTKDVFDEHSLVGDAVFSYVPHLSLAYHVHRFDPLKRSPCRSKGAESLARSKAPFYRSMILLEDVVQVLYCRQRQRRLRSPAFFNSAMALGYDGFPSTLITRGRGRPGDRKA